MQFKHLPVLLGLMILASPAFAQVTVHDESIDGELSDSGPAPSTLGVLGLGLNTIQGSLGGLGAGGGGGASNGNDADIFTFSVAAGQTVNAISTTRSDDNLGFIGYANASSLAAFSDDDTLGGAVDAGGLFGNDPLQAASGLTSIPSSLGAGDHTFILQETAAPVDFSISFNVVQAVPEPSSAALLSGLALLGFVRRRRS